MTSDSGPDGAPPMGREDARSLVANLLDSAPDADFSAKQILGQHPWLNQFPSCVIDLAYEEYCRSREQGNPIPASEFVGQFSSVEQSLYRVIEFDQVLHDHPSLVEEIPEDRWPREGSHFCGFELVEQIGRGALSRVFVARQSDLGNREVVVKVCIRGEREADLLGMLEFEGIARVYSIHPDAVTGLVAICMPLETRVTMHHMAEWGAGRAKSGSAGRIDGRALRRFVASLNPETLNRSTGSQASNAERRVSQLSIRDDDTFSTIVIKWGVQLSNALQHAHTNKVLHCDVKPGNVLLMPGLSAALLDFNLASSEMDLVRLAGGTLPYMASEQLMLLLNSDSHTSDADSSEWPAADLSSATDVFGLCATLWHLATGSPPFGAAIDVKSRSIAARHLLQRQQDGIGRDQMARIAKVLPAKLVKVLVRGLSFEPSGRHATALDLATELKVLLPRRKFYRHPLVFGGVVVCAGAALIASIAISLRQPELPESPPPAKTALVAANNALSLLRNADYFAAEIELRQFESANSECRFLDLFRRTCVAQSPVCMVAGRKRTPEQDDDVAHWVALEDEWKNLAELTPYSSDAWINCMLVRIELEKFGPACEAFQKAVQAGFKPLEHPRLTRLYNLLSRTKKDLGSEMEQLAELRQQVFEDGTRAEFIALIEATKWEIFLNKQLSAKSAEALIEDLVGLLERGSGLTAEPSAAYLFTVTAPFRFSKTIQDRVMDLVRKEAKGQYNRLGRIMLLPEFSGGASK